MGTTNVTKEVVELTAVDNATRVIQGVGNAATNLGKVYDGLIAKMGSLGLAVAGLGSAGAFGAMIKSTIEAEAGLLRLSEKTGNTVEALSSLMRVAKMSDTDMDTVAKGMQKLAKSMAEAESGTGKAAQVFKALDISLRDSTGQMKPTQVVMQELGQKLMAMNDQTLAVAFAQETLGKAGANLLPFLYELARAGELQAKVTTDQAKAAKEFEDNLVKLKSSSSEFWRHLTNDMLPTMNKYLDQLVEGKKIFGGWWEAMKGAGLTNPFRSVESQQASARDDVQRLLAYQRDASGAPGFDAGVTARDLAAAQKKLAWFNYMQRQQVLENQGDNSDQNSRRFGPKGMNIANPFAAGEGGGGDPAEAERIRQLLAVYELMKEAWKEGEGIRIAEAKAAEAQRLADEKLRQQYENEAEALRKLIDPTRQYVQAIAEAQVLMERGVITQDELTAATLKYQEAINRVLDKDLPKTVDKTNDLVREMGATFTSAFEKAVVGGQKFSVVLKSLAQDMLTIMLRKTITEPLGGLIGGLFGGGGGLGGLAGMFNIGGMFGPSLGGGGGATAGLAMPFMPMGFASGGDFNAGQPMMVGEQGPELMVPRGAGTVIPNGALGGGDMNVTINAQGADAAGLRRVESALMALHQSFDGRAVGAVQKAYNRRGFSTPLG